MNPLPVSIVNPLELVVDRIGLTELVRDNLRMHEAAQLTTVHTDASRIDAMLRIEQLKAFMGTLEANPAPHVTVFLYPEEGNA